MWATAVMDVIPRHGGRDSGRGDVTSGRRPRGVGINCLVALEGEAWRNELGLGYRTVTWCS